MQMRVLLGLAVATLLVVGPGAAGAQQCDAGDQCTANNMCREGICTGTSISSGGCDDVNDDGEVAINELIVGVNVVLGSAQLTQCRSFDRNSDGEVAINELILGVNAALGSCVG